MAVASSVAAGAGNAQIYTGMTRLMGWSIVESAGTPALATAVIRDGTTTGDPIIAQIGLLASTSTVAWFGPNGIIVKTGIFLNRLTGTTTVTVYLA